MAPGVTISLDDVLASAPIVQTKLDEEFFHVRFEKATPRERRYMAAMADLGNGPYRTSEIAKRLSSRASATSAVRDSLIKKGLIYSPGHGDVDFTVPHFSPFMRRRYPLEARSLRMSDSTRSYSHGLSRRIALPVLVVAVR